MVVGDFHEVIRFHIYMQTYLNKGSCYWAIQVTSWFLICLVLFVCLFVGGFCYYYYYIFFKMMFCSCQCKDFNQSKCVMSKERT